jgi:hypothetical protein
MPAIRACAYHLKLMNCIDCSDEQKSKRAELIALLLFCSSLPAGSKLL